MRFCPTDLPGVLLVEYTVFEDHRGFFLESWRADDFEKAGLSVPFVQDSHSRSMKGVLRGLHYQIQQPQGKLIRVVGGEVFDVAVDIRRSSPSFGKWFGVTLSASKKKALWIPAGFAHGFYVTSDAAEIVYKATNYYAPQHERSIRWDDPRIGIKWPIAKGESPLLSEKDADALNLADADCFP